MGVWDWLCKPAPCYSPYFWRRCVQFPGHHRGAFPNHKEIKTLALSYKISILVSKTRDKTFSNLGNNAENNELVMNLNINNGDAVNFSANRPSILF